MAIILTIPHFNENPAVITVVLITALFFILFIGEKHYEVYTDRISVTTNSIAALLFNNKGSNYQLKEIKIARLPSEKITIAAAGILGIIATLSSNGITRQYPIYLEMKNGEIIKIDTLLNKKTRIGLVDQVNSSIKSLS
jgi:hypothetical protein